MVRQASRTPHRAGGGPGGYAVGTGQCAGGTGQCAGGRARGAFQCRTIYIRRHTHRKRPHRAVLYAPCARIARIRALFLTACQVLWRFSGIHMYCVGPGRDARSVVGNHFYVIDIKVNLCHWSPADSVENLARGLHVAIISSAHERVACFLYAERDLIAVCITAVSCKVPQNRLTVARHNAHNVIVCSASRTASTRTCSTC